VEDEQPATGTQHAIDLALHPGEIARERRPQAQDDVGGVVGRVDARLPVRRRERDARSELCQLPGTDPVGAIEQEHVTPPHRAQCIERTRDLRLDIEDAGQSLGQPVPEFDREICHRRRV
jgi:hypothetical protein